MAREAGLGRALEIILSAQDFGADEAEKFGTINRALNPNEITEYVDKLATRISKFPSASIENCKKMVRASINMPIENALLEKLITYINARVVRQLSNDLNKQQKLIFKIACIIKEISNHF